MNVGDVKWYGEAELGKNLDKLFKEDAKKAIRVGVKSGAEVFRKDVQWRVPVKSGELLSKVEVVTAPTKDGGFKAKIGVKYSGKVAASARARRSTKKKKGGGDRKGWWNQHGFFESGGLKPPSSEDPAVYAYFVEMGRPGKKGHTHQTAQPFMRPAFDAKVKDAEKEVGEVLWKEITKRLGNA